MAAEHTIPCASRIASNIPYVAPAESTTAPSEPMVMAVVIISALARVRQTELQGRDLVQGLPGIVDRAYECDLTCDVRPASDPRCER